MLGGEHRRNAGAQPGLFAAVVGGEGLNCVADADSGVLRREGLVEEIGHVAEVALGLTRRRGEGREALEVVEADAEVFPGGFERRAGCYV